MNNQIDQNEVGKSVAVVGALGLVSFFATKLFSSAKTKHQWELTESKEDTVSHPVDIGVKLDVYQGINESEGKWNVDWKRRDGMRGTVYADTEKAAVKKALKEAESA